MPKLKIKAVNKKGQTYLSTDIALLIKYLALMNGYELFIF